MSGRVLITGATGGAGAGVLEAFHDAGWSVAGTTRGDPPVDAGDTSWVSADLSDPATAQRAANEALAALGGLDALVCLTGGFGLTAIDELTWEDVERQLGSGLRPTVEAILACRPALEADGRGAIVTIGSQAALRPGPRAAPVAVAKAGVIAFSASVAAALRPRGVRVNCVLPGTIDTPANRDAMPAVKRETWVTPRQLGELIVFLCSPASAPLTGAAIPIG